MKRKIVTIDAQRCNGCGLCVRACREGALQMIDGKARLVSDSYCDGLGDCLPACPMGAITIEERVAAPFDAAAVIAAGGRVPGGNTTGASPAPATATQAASQLAQWPCQIKLVPVNAPWLDGARLLIAADCAAYASASMHTDYMRGRVTLIGCPRLDGVDYAEKLGAILRNNNIRSVMVVRMQVPCCGGLERAATDALLASGKMIPWQVVTLATDGTVAADD